MAHVYIYSGAAGAGTGADWANAYTTVSAAYAAKAAGDNFWLAHDHAQSGASPSLQSPATAALPCTAICVNRAGSVPPVSADLRTTATITASSGNLTIGAGGEYIYYYGITFIVAATNINIGTGTTIEGYFKSCTFKQTTSGRASFVGIGSGVGAYVVWDNVTADIAGTDNVVTMNFAHLLWKNSATPVTTAFPVYLLYSNNGSAVLEGVDLSAAGFSGNYVSLFHAGSDGSVTVKNCKTHSGLLQVASGGPFAAGAAFYYINTDSSGTNYRNEKKTYQGSQVPETTIVRTGGATDGTTPISTKIVTTNSNWLFPFEAMLQPVFNTSTAANVTVTVSGIWGGGAVPNNDDIWIEVSYLGASTSPIATLNTANGKSDYLATATAQATDAGSTWGGSTTKFKMAVTLSSPQPALTGPIYVTVKAAKASSTFYVDPKPVLS